MPSFVTRQLDVAGHSLTLQLPADPEQLLADAANSEQDDDPYWGILWDAAATTAECVLQTRWPRGQRTLEVGCGAGLVGIAGLMAGLQVTFSDLVPAAVDLAVHNAARNGFPAAHGRALDWRRPGADDFDVLLASDVLYDRQLHAPLLQFAAAMLAAAGQFWIGDPGRQHAHVFLAAAKAAGWHVRLHDRYLRPMAGPTLAKFQLIILSHPGPTGETATEMQR